MPAPDAAYIGIDVGGTFLKGARIDATGKVLARLHEPIRKASSAELLGQLAGAVETLEKGAGPAVAVGVGLPGIVEMTKGRVRSAPNVPALDGLKVGEELEARTGRASFAENDANAAALAEAWLGAGRGADHVLYVTLGTGVGGGLVFDGRIWMGRNGYAGEIGHIQVEPDGIPCGCGSWGCLETIAGVPGWTRRARGAAGLRARLDPRRPLAARSAGDRRGRARRGRGRPGGRGRGGARGRGRRGRGPRPAERRPRGRRRRRGQRGLLPPRAHRRGDAGAAPSPTSLPTSPSASPSSDRTRASWAPRGSG